VQTVLPAVLNVPGAHFSTVDVPSQMLPAWHDVHSWRVEEVHPVDLQCVKDGLGQDWQEPLPAAEYRESAPHGVHELLPAGLKVPALHALLTLVPSHWLPATHGTHPVRATVDPPWVWLPAAQTEQLAAPARANRLSEPQFVHVLLPAELYVPGAHFTATLVPSHAYPARHALHAWRVVVVPPLVCDPVAQATH